MHWVLDVVFREDESRVCKDNGPENLAMIKHAVMNKLKTVQQSSTKKTSLKALRKKAGWDDNTLEDILLARM